MRCSLSLDWDGDVTCRVTALGDCSLQGLSLSTALTRALPYKQLLFTAAVSSVQEQVVGRQVVPSGTRTRELTGECEKDALEMEVTALGSRPQCATT